MRLASASHRIKPRIRCTNTQHAHVETSKTKYSKKLSTRAWLVLRLLIDPSCSLLIKDVLCYIMFLSNGLTKVLNIEHLKKNLLNQHSTIKLWFQRIKCRCFMDAIILIKKERTFIGWSLFVAAFKRNIKIVDWSSRFRSSAKIKRWSIYDSPPMTIEWYDMMDVV